MQIQSQLFGPVAKIKIVTIHNNRHPIRYQRDESMYRVKVLATAEAVIHKDSITVTFIDYDGLESKEYLVLSLRKSFSDVTILPQARCSYVR